jgi:cobalt-zinc-cadmium efflux system outer membrane protein
MSSTSVFRAARSAPLAIIASTLGCATTYGAPSIGAMRAEYARAEPTAGARQADERALASPRLDRCAFVAAVLDQNPTVEAARQAWRAALAHARSTGAIADPMVDVAIAPLSIGSTSVPFGISVELSQRLPWPEKLMLEDEAAKYDALASEKDYGKARRELALAAARLYDDYFVAVRSLRTNERHVAIGKDLKRTVLAALESGRASAQDPIAADTELAHMEHAAMVYGAERDVIMARMNALLHRAPGSALPAPVETLSPPRPVAPAAPRPEIEAASLRARAERTRAARWRRDWIPDLTLMMSYDTMWAMPEHRWMVGLGLTLPIEIGHRAAAADEAEAQAARHDDEAVALTDTARAEVAVARTRSEEAEHIASLYDGRLVPSARAQLDAARAAFESSRSDFTTVLAAERGLRSIELDAEKMHAEVDRRRAELDDALGAVACGSEVPR